MDARSILFWAWSSLFLAVSSAVFSMFVSTACPLAKASSLPLSLSALRLFDSMVSQHPAGHLALFAGPLRQLQSAHFQPLFSRRTADGPDVPRPLDQLRPPITALGAGLCSSRFRALFVATFIDIEHFIIPDEITLGGIVVGFICSFLVPSLHGADAGVFACVTVFLGIIVGGGLIYSILRVGKILFGKKKLQLPAETLVVFTEDALVFEGQTIPFEDLFYRKTDVIAMEARRVELIDRCYSNIAVRLTPEELHLGDEVLKPEDVLHMEVLTERMVLPQEAMGFGDVKFMAAIGAFLGWQATLFCLMVSSIIGAVVGLLLIVLKKQEWSSRLPYGPYIALAATIWILEGSAFSPGFSTGCLDQLLPALRLMPQRVIN